MPGRRVTIKISEMADQDLSQLVANTGHNQTDVINRAIRQFAYLYNLARAGDEVLVRPQDATELERIIFT
jgi:hypothetical protein